jgi:hypothetical protein
MSILGKVNIKTIIIILSVIVVILVGSVYFLTNTDREEWVFVLNTGDCNIYYNKDSISIDTQDYIIKVWVKLVYTDKVKQEFQKTHNEEKYKDIDYMLAIILFNYKERNINEKKNIYFSKSNEVIKTDELSGKWEDLIPGYNGDIFLNKLLKDYNIKR